MHKISKLKNGINLVKVPLKGSKAVTVMAMFPVGSRYEGKKISGASHFVEHMMFKGTKKRPTHLDISRELDSLGAEYNAFTSKDFTGYYVRTGEINIEKAFDWLADIIFNSKFDAEEIAKEKGVIVEELRMYEDNPLMAVDTLFEKAAFGDHPLGWDVGGTPESVNGLSREDLWNYYQNYYLPSNMVLVVAGNINNKKLAKSLKYFENNKTNPTPRPSPFREGIKGGVSDLKNNFGKFVWPKNNLPLETRVVVSEKKLDQAQVIIGFPGLRYNDPDRFAASVLLNILGGGMSSRLFVEVREKRGLAYMVNAGGGAFRDVGVATIQAGLDPFRLADALKVIKDELIKIKDTLVSAKELLDSKNNIAGHTELAMENSGAQAQWFAKQFWFSDKIETYEQVTNKIKKVTAADVKRVAKKLFDINQMRVAVIGPLSKDKVITLIKN
ncbi:MAG: Peptidase, M16 family [Candidatus Magasanikbacteria bacterium GW2011_GWA2_40_10]|uniref:Peptidase, M16 family n=1 Tax=Candidatus Magasanikbacteria bacterium GW2011_GWA2_40_10 TaxID=1619037 RepID=A0A0G0Q5W0_9BACT|nr:MAG: Peptidase, M16 family [Candidatus Magasanikbacteria bacterium GW2011_GWA2_40_10]